MIEVKKISKKFGKTTAVNNISFDLSCRTVTALMGPNGSGKSTLLKMFLGLVNPDSGTINIDGKITAEDYNYKSLIGYMPQAANYPKNLRVKEIFKILKELRINSNTIDYEMFDDLQIKDFYDKQFGSLSGGQKQRVNAAVCFLFDPKILILDEPTAGLDLISNAVLKRKILKEKSKGKLILVTTHFTSEVIELADRLLYLLDGKIYLDRFLKGNENLKSKLFENLLKEFQNRIAA